MFFYECDDISSTFYFKIWSYKEEPLNAIALLISKRLKTKNPFRIPWNKYINDETFHFVVTTWPNLIFSKYIEH